MITFDEMIHMIYEKIKSFVISILPPPMRNVANA